jgi:hypothetical protein
MKRTAHDWIWTLVFLAVCGLFVWVLT